MNRPLQSLVWILLSILLLSGSAFAGPPRPDEISADAAWAAHVDVERLLSSRFGEHLVAMLRREDDFEEVEEFAKQFDFNPLEDVYGVTVYGNSFRREEAAILVRGRFNQKKMLETIRSHTTVHTEPYQGQTIYRGEDAGDDISFCFYQDGLVLFSNKQHLLQEAIDVLSRRKRSLADAGARADMGSIPNGAILAAVATGLDTIIPHVPQAKVLQKAEGVRIVAGEDRGVAFVEATLSTDSAHTASQVHDVLRGLLALGSMVSEEHPEVSQLVQDTRVEQSGNQVTIYKSHPTDALFELLRKRLH